PALQFQSMPRVLVDLVGQAPTYLADPRDDSASIEVGAARDINTRQVLQGSDGDGRQDCPCQQYSPRVGLAELQRKAKYRQKTDDNRPCNQRALQVDEGAGRKRSRY